MFPEIYQSKNTLSLSHVEVILWVYFSNSFYKLISESLPACKIGPKWSATEPHWW